MNTAPDELGAVEWAMLNVPFKPETIRGVETPSSVQAPQVRPLTEAEITSPFMPRPVDGQLLPDNIQKGMRETTAAVGVVA